MRGRFGGRPLERGAIPPDPFFKVLHMQHPQHRSMLHLLRVLHVGEGCAGGKRDLVEGGDQTSQAPMHESLVKSACDPSQRIRAMVHF